MGNDNSFSKLSISVHINCMHGLTLKDLDKVQQLLRSRYKITNLQFQLRIDRNADIDYNAMQNNSKISNITTLTFIRLSNSLCGHLKVERY